MRSRRLLPMLFAFVFFVYAPTVVIAQETSFRSHHGECELGESLGCVILSGRQGDERDTRSWLRAVVLWRHPAVSRNGCPAVSEAEQQATYDRWREKRRRAEELGRNANLLVHCATGISVEISRRSRLSGADTIFVFDRHYPVPMMSDSALVVLIEGGATPASPPRLVGTTTIGSVIDPAYWGKNWTSGDTTFFVRPRAPEATLHAALAVSPLVRALLTRTP